MRKVAQFYSSTQGLISSTGLELEGEVRSLKFTYSLLDVMLHGLPFANNSLLNSDGIEIDPSILYFYSILRTQ